MTDTISEKKLDLLKEIGNIGTAHAATSLSQLLNRKVDMEVPTIKVVDLSEAIEVVGGAEQLILSVLIQITGDIEGNMFFILKPDQKNDFIKEAAGLKWTESEEMFASVMNEIANVLCGSYISALSDFTGLAMYNSVPSLAIDMAGSILSVGLVEAAMHSDQVIILDGMLSTGNAAGENFDIFILLFPDPNSFDKIFKKLGVYEIGE